MSALDCSRREAALLCAHGKVSLDGRRVAKGDRALGAELCIELESEEVLAQPELAIEVRLERPDVVLVSKPAGMPTVPLQPEERGTLANALVARYPEMRTIGYRRREPGVIHRLDTETSGLVLAARTPEAFATLTQGLQAGLLVKRYLAVVEASLPDAGVIEASLRPDRSQTGKVALAPLDSDAGYRRASVTRYRVMERGAEFALVELEAGPAFRHQIRAHLASVGHPIAGDALYGGRRASPLGARHALHASYVAWAGERIPSFSVTDPTPGVFLDLVRATPIDVS
jgi:23S rRNA pseudouridine1911/1915/1917 synthase